MKDVISVLATWPPSLGLTSVYTPAFRRIPKHAVSLFLQILFILLINYSGYFRITVHFIAWENWTEFIHIQTYTHIMHTWINITWLLWTNEWTNEWMSAAIPHFIVVLHLFFFLLLLLSSSCPSAPWIFAPFYMILYFSCNYWCLFALY